MNPQKAKLLFVSFVFGGRGEGIRHECMFVPTIGINTSPTHITCSF